MCRRLLRLCCTSMAGSTKDNAHLWGWSEATLYQTFLGATYGIRAIARLACSILRKDLLAEVHDRGLMKRPRIIGHAIK